jgi:hypothetical protein
VSPEEETALRGLLWDHFQLKADLAQERQCIDRAIASLDGLVTIFAGNRPDKVDVLASITDDVRRHLATRRSKP